MARNIDVKNISRRRFCFQSTAALVGSAGLATVLGSRAHAQVGDRGATMTPLIDIETDRAIERGLEFLASRQQDDGAFGAAGSSEYAHNVGVVALAGMAFMSHGSTPGRGRYGKHVDRCVDYVLKNSEESGFVTAPGASSHGPMYGHGFATMFLAEAYGMSMRPDLRDRLSKAVKLIVSTQNKEGGWRYQPQRQDADLSVTVCQIMALRAARNAGLYVPHETIEASVDFVKRSQNADGGFMYMVHGGDSLFPRSAAGVVALYSSGMPDVYDWPEVKKGVEYLMRFLPKDRAAARQAHFFYGHYYAVQAMWHFGGDHWDAWYTGIRDVLLSRQEKRGSWNDAICREYGTAMALIILQMPNSYLPIFQR